MSRGSVKRIIERIRESKTFLITAHMNLEGDALGSELATYALLKKLRKKPVICNNDITPHVYKFLPFSSVIKNELDDDQTFDVAMVLDCSDSSRTGKVKNYLSRVGCIINIDHHISNTSFGDLNWVDPKASSACQMLYKLCEKMKVIDKKIALCLYTGIFTDTGNFTYANATKDTHKIVANLLNYKISPHAVYTNLHSMCVPSDLKFMSRIISYLKYDARRQICWAAIKKWEDKEYDLTEMIFNIMRLLEGVEVFLLFKKLPHNKVRVNFRSRSRVDVNRIAKFFGGGGHKRASGTTMEDSLEGAQKKVIAFIKRYTNGVKRKQRR